ncbi:MAG: DNA-binding protein WhiA [Clostridia bacterium]|nr:DNA-binding protein WhiA [Clostridia bacterium]MCI2000224.1 DNA-binding protein WhiA [Clostridia bacterium]MCI2014611.1 DNA-binding protein WhiA [Clostridia bacterium]
MSFSSNVKRELLHQFGEESSSNLAELTAIINLCGQIEKNDDGFCIKIHTENVLVARKFFTLMKKNFNIDCSISVTRNSQLKKNRVYFLSIESNKSKDAAEKIRNMCFSNSGGKYKYINEDIFKSVCSMRAYLRGAFLAAGSLSEPEKTYHLEIVGTNYDYCVQLKAMLAKFGINAGYILRKEHHVIYVKEGEKVADLLNIIGAHVSLMDFENIRILKDMRNNVNRRVNCETANLSKTIAASVKQIEDINFIKERFGLDYLDKSLKEAAMLRIKYPDLSLKELGQKLNPPVGKSGINHRLHRISDIAEQLMEGMKRKND